MYPLDEVELPPHIEGDLDDLSRSGRDYALIPTTSGEHGSVVKYGQWENAVSSYLATASFVDEMLGKLVDSLESSGQADNTWKSAFGFGNPWLAFGRKGALGEGDRMVSSNARTFDSRTS